MISCKEASQLLSQSLDQPLKWRERFSLKLHLFVCHFCRLFALQLTQVRVAFKQTVSAVEDDEQLHMPQLMREKITNALNEH